MFTFSKVQDYEGDPAVKEILVFNSSNDQAHYNQIIKADASNIYANSWVAYKLKAVMKSDKTWESNIRISRGSLMVYCSEYSFDTYEQALRHAHAELSKRVIDSLQGQHFELNLQLGIETQPIAI